ncbi:MAG: DUF4303 domain-containing protein [Lachnospiraceae bacterium]|nr:DUF4303 domain-containing protein [Lachnospiraceae bacterium]
MDLAKFDTFNKECSENLAGAIDEILRQGQEQKIHAIGFITTDDFYGFYLSWDYDNSDIEEYYEWEQGLEPDFLYQPVVDVVDSCEEIDFTTSSDEKWDFAKALLTILEKNIKQLPDEIFTKNHYKREDILFFATMSDGDYIEEMLNASVKMFNSPETAKA